MFLYKKAKHTLMLALSLMILVTSCTSGQRSDPVPEKESSEAVAVRLKVIEYNVNDSASAQKDSIYLKYNGKPLNLSLPVYLYRGRYYLPLHDTLARLGSVSASINGISTIAFNGANIDLNTLRNTYYKKSKLYTLYKRGLNLDGDYYMSLFDLAEMLELIVDWNVAGKTVSLYTRVNQADRIYKPAKGKNALVRLEDITAVDDTGGYPAELEYYRVMADYFYSNAIPFSVAWVPRYINPGKNIDNDLAGDYSMYNVDFVFTLDYFISRGGVIGLHGYTHQYGKKASVAGVEFGPGVNEDDASTRQRYKMAIDSAKALEIPVGFFEFPHYAATKRQFRIAEEYFAYIYEHPYNQWGGKIVQRKSGQRIVKYIPTPLDYLNSKKDIAAFIGKINSLGANSLASFFFHPHLDYEFIKVSRDTIGRPSYSYSEKSLLHQIVNAIEKRGYKFVKPSDL